MVVEAQIPGVEAWWGEYPAEQWSDAIVTAMKLGGVDNLFFVSGSELNFYQEAIAKARAKGRPAPRLVTMMHEHVALNAALGDTMVRNQPAATAVHVDVGTLHYGAALHAAWRGNYPVLMTAGTGPRAFPNSMRGARSGTIQWIQEPRDQGEIVRQYTKLDHRLEHQDNPALMVSRLLQVAMSEPRGPVYMAVPQETAMLPLQGSARFPTRDQLGLARPVWPDPSDARRIAEWLVKSDNPCMYSMKVGHQPEAIEELVRLAELLALPYMESSNSDRMNFPNSSPYYGTGPEPRDADVLLIFEDLAPYIPGEGSPSPDAKIAWVSIDPVMSRFKTFEYRADLWTPASSAAVARAVFEAATGMLTTSDLTRIAARRERLGARKREMDAQDERLAQQDLAAGRLNGRVVAYELAKLLDSDAIILNDGLSNGGFIQTYTRRYKAGTYFRSGSSAGGWGSGAAFGVKLARPNRDVVLASGDGFYTFGTPMPALWAAGHHKAAFLVLVFVNQTYGTGTTGLERSYPEGYAVAGGYEGGRFDDAPNFAKLAEAANGYGERVSELSQLVPALRRGLDFVRENIPAVVAIDVPPPVHLTSSRGTSSG
ncbi:MAG TPA: thiamine pyrophosphate-dependent enzyme [Dehalococcoidia bacterium]|nr:thiamine pyrophosphate-dependent enzyme [Dehalococcoidia bacterium]